MALKPGHILQDRYEIKEKVGTGGFGNVYRAYDKRFGDDVAVKEFSLFSTAQFGDLEEMRKRFEQEARITRKLEHPHIVSIYNLFYAHETCYIVMPFLSETLSDWLKAQKYLAVPEGVRVMQQICAGMGYAHTFRVDEESTAVVVHCDIKPGNILFNRNKQAKITDFGIAHVSEDIDASYKTVGDFKAGTVEYMSPEQLKGIRNDPRIDVYALGALFYTILTGRNYLDLGASTTGHAQAKNIMSIIQDEPSIEPLKEKNIPEPLIRIILKALSKKPENRYANASEMHEAILAYQHAPGVAAKVTPSAAPGVAPKAAPSPELSPPQEKPATRFLPLVAIIGIVGLCLVLGVGGGIFAWLSLDSTPEATTAGPDDSSVASPPTDQPTPESPASVPTNTPTSPPTDQPSAEPTAEPTATAEPVETPDSPPPPASPISITCSEEMLLISASPHLNVANDFCMDIHEVTNAAYQQCEEAGVCEPPKMLRSQSQSDYYGHDDFADYPVIQVTWLNAQAYCDFVGQRLPTASEWDRAAGGPEGNSYPDISDDLIKEPNDAIPVKSVEQDVSAEGVYDLMGNVQEWVDEEAGINKVIKGGSFSSGVEKSIPDLAHFNVGFRCTSDGVTE
ncbi:MAG: protein kinase [Planctomycetes bacterium]|nr:protein kinase [Planctomycetota bacterium]